jgi:chloride channel 3/4/5
MTERSSSSIAFSGPSPISWRRQRLLRIGSTSALTSNNDNGLSGDSGDNGDNEHEQDQASESTLLRANTSPHYGTLPVPRRRLFTSSPISFRGRRNFPALPGLITSRHRSASVHDTPYLVDSPNRSPVSFRDISYWANQRPISSYDPPFNPQLSNTDTDLAARTNGIRVWYSSFSSIDWLHDAIKDRVRFSRLRKRTSLRARIRLNLDKSMGWFIVTIVGFLTAVLAFLIVRSEQWLFDSKEGYCKDNWRKAKRFCCPVEVGNLTPFPWFIDPSSEEKPCEAWITWGEVFNFSGHDSGSWMGLKTEFIQYIVYAVIAVS